MLRIGFFRRINELNREKIDKRLYSPSHKAGFKILSKEQLENIFPTFENLKRKIKTHREKIKDIEIFRGKEMDFQFNLMYDSIFSIWGKRGSGKTSALFTLKYNLENDNDYDLILPVVMPEMLPANCDIIAWIMAVLDSEIQKIEQKIEGNQNLIRDEDFFKHCVFNPNNRLRLTYNRVKELVSSRYSNGIFMGESYAESIGNTERYTQNSFDFSKELALFWDILANSIKKANNLQNDIEPLIFIMFDDVDLTPDKVVELFSVIIKYLSHPNLIVITTADEELFHDVIENDLNKKIGQNMIAENLQKVAVSMAVQWETYDRIIEYVRGNTPIQQRVKETAELYIDKVLPPSERYYLELFDNCQKRKQFIVETDKENNSINLEGYMRKQINKLSEYFSESSDIDIYNNFLYYNKDKNNFLQCYLLFMGSTSRQLVNQCFILEELIERIICIYEEGKKIETSGQHTFFHQKMYKQVQHFLCNSMNAGSLFEGQELSINKLIEHIWIFQKEQFPLYIDYDYLLMEYFEKKKAISDKNENIRLLNDTIALFMLLFFVENILLMGDRQEKYYISLNRKKVHGSLEFILLLDSTIYNRSYSLINRAISSDIKEMLYLFENVIVHADSLFEFDLTQFYMIRDYIYDISSKQLSFEISPEIMEFWNHENPKWFKTVSKGLYLLCEGISSMKSRDFINIDINMGYFFNKSGLAIQERKKGDVFLNGERLLNQILMQGEKEPFIYTKLIKVIEAVKKIHINFGPNLFEKFEELINKNFNNNMEIDNVRVRLESQYKNENLQKFIRVYTENQFANKREEILILNLLLILFCEEDNQLYSILEQFPQNNTSENKIKNWLRIFILEIQDKIRETFFMGVCYQIVNKKKIEEAVTGVYVIEKRYSLRNTYAYECILDACRKEEKKSFIIDFSLVERMFDQIRRTKEEIGRMNNEYVTLEIMQQFQIFQSDIEENIILVVNNRSEYKFAVEYILLLQVMDYFVDIYLAILLQEQKRNIFSSFPEEMVNNRKTPGIAMYLEMNRMVKRISSKETNIKYMQNNKKSRAQFYLGNLLREYFIEAGDEYLHSLGEKNDE